MGPGDDDYAMLSLPLVCRAFHRSCVSVVILAFRLASRLRQVADTLPPGQPSASSLGWLLGHTWGAIIEAKGFLEDGADLERRTSAFAAAPRAVSSLRVL